MVCQGNTILQPSHHIEKEKVDIIDKAYICDSLLVEYPIILAKVSSHSEKNDVCSNNGAPNIH